MEMVNINELNDVCFHINLKSKRMEILKTTVGSGTRAERPRFKQPPIQWVPEAVSPGLKRLMPEANHSPPSTAEIKNGWNYRESQKCVAEA